jgi:cobalt/nickel transport system permease protein
MLERHPSLSHVLHPAHHAGSYLTGVDPRVRLVTATVLAVAIAASNRFTTLGIAIVAALLAVALARLSPTTVLRRLLPMELVVLLIVAMVPWTARGTPAVSAGALHFSREGLTLAATIALKANAILLGLLATVGTMDAPMLAHALAHLHVPRKLAHLMLFTIRYLDVLHREYRRLRAAMKVRSFRPRMNLHTYRALGYLIGMLLVHSFDRSERVLAAMRCRGFRGQFHLLEHFAFSRRRDVPFCAASLALLAILVYVEWT